MLSPPLSLARSLARSGRRRGRVAGGPRTARPGRSPCSCRGSLRAMAVSGRGGRVAPAEWRQPWPATSLRPVRDPATGAPARLLPDAGPRHLGGDRQTMPFEGEAQGPFARQQGRPAGSCAGGRARRAAQRPGRSDVGLAWLTQSEAT